ncbi:hypothetical protein D3C80_1935420 [compost metagenome]
MQRLAAWQQHTATGGQAQGIMVVPLLLALAMEVKLNLMRPTGQATLQRKWRRIADAGMFHFGHD